MLLNGILLPITTPFYRNGQVYYKKLAGNVERYSRSPVAGITVLDAVGEPSLLSDEEKRSVLQCAAENASAEKVLIASSGAESAIETLRLTEHAASLGYDVALIRTPTAYRRQMQALNLLSFYRFVADRSPLPIVLGLAVFGDNTQIGVGDRGSRQARIGPAGTEDLSVEMVAELAEHPNVIGLADAGGDPEKVRAVFEKTRHIHRISTVTDHFEPLTGRMLRAAAAASDAALIPAGALAAFAGQDAKPSSGAVDVVGKLRTRQKDTGFQILAGETHFLESLQAGAVGGSMAFAVAAPGACFEIFAAFKDGDIALAGQKQQRISQAAARIVDELGIPGLKYSMDLNGYYGGIARLPWLPLDGETRREIEDLMADIRS